MNIKQLIKGIFIKDNTIIQQDNVYQNEEIIDEYMKSCFNEIDRLFEMQEYKLIEEKLYDIYSKKKDRFNDKLEMRLLKYNSLLCLLKGDYKKLDEYLFRLKQYGDDTEELIQVKFNIAIFKKDNELFKQIKDAWINKNYPKNSIEENEMIFLYMTKQFNELIATFYNEEYLDKNKCIYYIAKSLVEIDREEEAVILLEGIKDIDDKFKVEFIVSKIIKILKKPRYLGEATIDERLLFKECLEIIKEINLNNLDGHYIKVLTYYKLYMLIFTDKSGALEEINNIPKHLNDIFDFKILKINILNLNYKYEDADIVCNSLLEECEDIKRYIGCILEIKLFLEKWKEIINIFNKYGDIVKDNEFCFYVYGLALLNYYGEEYALKVIDIECNISSSLIDIFYAKANLQDRDKYIYYLNKAVEKIADNKLLLLDIVKMYKDIDAYEYVVEILEENCKDDIRFFKKYISVVINRNLEEKYENILDVYKEHYSGVNNEYIDSNIYSIYLEDKKYRNAYYIANKVFKYKKNIYWTNEYLRMKLINKEISELKELADILYNESKPEYLITAGEAYLKLGDFEKVESIVYKVSYDIDDIDIQFSIRISNLLLQTSKCKDEEISNYVKEENNKVKLDDIVIIQNEVGKKIAVCLNKESFYRTNNIRFGCLHIDEKHDLWIELLGSNINEEIKYELENYTIKEIVNKIKYVAQKCFNKRVDENIEKLETISFNPEGNDLTELKIKLKEQNDAQQECVDLYMSRKNEIGMPINIISNDVRKITQVIEYLLANKETRFITGIPIDVEAKSKVILTVVSMLFLNKYKLLDEFIEHYDVYIPSSMVGMIDEIIKDYIINFDKQESYINLIKDRIILDKKDEKYKKSRIREYKNILSLLNKCTIKEKNISKSEFLTIPEHLLFTPDIEAIEIAKENGFVVFNEDRCTSILYSQIYGLKVSNMGSFINKILFNDFKNYWSIIEELIKGKYEYLFDYRTLALLIINFKIDNKDNIKKFRNIINLILENDMENFYRDNLENICKRIFYLQMYKVMQVKTDIILSEIKTIDSKIEKVV